VSLSAVPVAERGLEWIQGGDEAEIVLSSRVRVARNLQGFPFPGRAGREERADAAERSDTRSDGLDSDEARWEAETELWESTLPALP